MDGQELQKSNTDEIKELAQAVSQQANLAKKVWYIFMAIALVVLFPPSDAGNLSGEVKLPLELGSVNGAEFYPIVFAIFGVLIVAFAAANAQLDRATKLAHQALDKIKSPALLGIHVNDLYDIFIESSINRVAPLAQVILGKYQFNTSTANCPIWRRCVTAIYYLILKLIAFAIYWLLPSLAFLRAFSKVQQTAMSSYLSYPILIIGLSSLVIVAYLDISYVFRVFKIFFTGKAPNS